MRTPKCECLAGSFPCSRLLYSNAYSTISMNIYYIFQTKHWIAHLPLTPAHSLHSPYQSCLQFFFPVSHVKSLEDIFNSSPCLTPHNQSVQKSWWFYLQNISRILPPFIIFTAAIILHLDYWGHLLNDLPNSTLAYLWLPLLNIVARVSFYKRALINQITPHLCSKSPVALILE